MLRFARAAALLTAAISTIGCNRAPQTPASATIDPKKFYAILLTNGSVYFGQVEGLGSPFLTLKDVYYVQSSQNPETKAVSNVLVKRGKEWHGPDRMIVNEKAVVFVEPVGADSKVAQLIAASRSEPRP